MEMQIQNYPNHMIEDGIVYRGTTTKRVVKPDPEGIYRIRYKQNDFYHTINELVTGVPRKVEAKKKEPRQNDRPTVKSLCKEYGIATSTYYKWLDRNYDGGRS